MIHHDPTISSTSIHIYKHNNILSHITSIDQQGDMPVVSGGNNNNQEKQRTHTQKGLMRVAFAILNPSNNGFPLTTHRLPGAKREGRGRLHRVTP